MSRIVLAALAAIALSAGTIEKVSAQDILSMMYAPVPVANWTGFYVGGNFGYGWAKDASRADSTISAAQSSFTMKGMIAGGQLGINVQTGKWVLGIESDIQGSWQKFSGASNGTNLFGAVGLPGFPGNDSVTMDWFGTTRVRAGVAADRVFVYGTGGIAYAGIRSTSNLSGITLLKDTPVKFGWAAGGGIEAMLSQNWTVKAEYLHLDFGGTDDQYIYSGTTPTTTINLHQRITDDIVRVGVNYIFR